MAQSKSSLEIVEEWKKKCHDFYTESDDELASTMYKLLDASSVILKGSDSSRIQRALAILEYERSVHLLSENTQEPTIRTMMFGVLQSIHGTLLDMTSSKVSTLSKETQVDEILNSSQSPSKPREETVKDSHSVPDNNQVLTGDLMAFKEKDLTGVDEVESAEMEEDGSPSLTGASMIPNFTAPFLAEPKKEPKEIKDEEMMDDFVIPNDNEVPIKPKEESAEDTKPIPDNNQVLTGDLMAFKEKNMKSDNVVELAEIEEEDSPSLNGVSMVPNFTPPFPTEPKKEIKEEETPNYNALPIKPKEESVDEIQDFSDDNQMFGDFDSILGEENNDITSNMDEIHEAAQDTESKDSSAKTPIDREGVKEGEKRGQSKNIAKKRKSSNEGISKSETALKKCRMMKANETDLECPECKYCTRSVKGWRTHLSDSHSTTPTLAGLVLRCGCGHESATERHGLKCDMAQYTVIAKSCPKTTPQCVMCETFPKTISGYIHHLRNHHNSTLKKINMFLKCSCGFDAFSNPGSHSTRYNKHSEECNSCQFTLHKLEND